MRIETRAPTGCRRQVRQTRGKESIDPFAPHSLTCVDRLLPDAQPCMQLPQSTHPFAFLGTGFGTSPEAAAPFHRLDWCWFTLKEALGVGQPWARCECSVLTLA